MSEKTEIAKCVNCIKRTSVFSMLSDEELKIIDDHRTEVVYKKGELLHKYGTQSSHVISFNYGMAKMYIDSNNGRNQIIKIIKPQEFIVSPGLFIDNRHHFSIKALCESIACLIDADIFKQIMKNNSQFAFEYIKQINKNLLQITEKMHNLVRKHNTGKLAETLLYLEQEVYMSNPFTLNMSSTDIAELSSVEKGPVMRILSDFHKEGIIDYNKKYIKILNRPLLENISENG
ncbi:MAG: Crp/Fnr family transcriptional regulator [Bacteroidales bacterium]|nr:Crp/Fnr family transcriptional regulator [Bacteroidales bacterium]